MLNVAFFWHMHQPYYRNPLNGEYSLPWVRLHALKGYYDMISLLEDYPAIRQTFNLVPSLIRQLNDYAGERPRMSSWNIPAGPPKTFLRRKKSSSWQIFSCVTGKT